MYLKIFVKNDGNEQAWNIIGGIQSLSYSIMNNVPWEDYEFLRSNKDFWVGPINKEEWSKVSTEKGYRGFVIASLHLENGTNVSCIWDTVAYLLGNDGKTIEVISAAG